MHLPGFFNFCLKFFVYSEANDSVTCETDAQSFSMLFLLVLQYFKIGKAIKNWLFKIFCSTQVFLNKKYFKHLYDNEEKNS